MKFRLTSTRATVFWLIISLYLFFLSFNAFKYGMVGYGIFMIILWIVAAWTIVYYCIIIKLIVDETGVSYKTWFKCYSMAWDEIKFIGIVNVPYFKMPLRISYIYFHRYKSPYLYLKSMFISENLITVNYRKTIIELIDLYWDGEIDNLETIKKK